MSLIESTQKELDVDLGQDLHGSVLAEVARRCGDTEVQEVKNRILLLNEEAEAIPEWDDATQDDVFFAKQFLERLLSMIEKNQ